MSIPDFIKETSSKIRHAVIGGKITNTIADGIEKITGVAQDSTDTTKDIVEYIKAVQLEWDSDPNKNPEVLEARGGQPRLKDRFENTDRQLAHKANQSFAEEVNTKAKSSHSRIDNLIIPISEENVNVEVTDAKVSPILNRTYDLLGQRLTDGERKLRTIETGMADISWENGHINLRNENIDRDNNIRTVENYAPYGNMTVHKENNRLAYIYIIDDNDVQRQTLTKMVTEFPKEQGKKYRFSAEGTLQNPLKIIDDVNSKEVVDSRSDFPSLNHRLTSLHDQLFADKSIDLIWEPGSISASNGLDIDISPRIRTDGFFNPFSDFYIDGGGT